MLKKQTKYKQIPSVPKLELSCVVSKEAQNEEKSQKGKGKQLNASYDNKICSKRCDKERKQLKITPSTKQAPSSYMNFYIYSLEGKDPQSSDFQREIQKLNQNYLASHQYKKKFPSQKRNQEDRKGFFLNQFNSLFQEDTLRSQPKSPKESANNQPEVSVQEVSNQPETQENQQTQQSVDVSMNVQQLTLTEEVNKSFEIMDKRRQSTKSQNGVIVEQTDSVKQETKIEQEQEAPQQVEVIENKATDEKNQIQRKSKTFNEIKVSQKGGTKAKNVEIKNRQTKNKISGFMQVKNGKAQSIKIDKSFKSQKVHKKRNFSQLKKVQFDENKQEETKESTVEQKESTLQSQNRFSKHNSFNSDFQQSLNSPRSKSTDFFKLDLSFQVEHKEIQRPSSAKIVNKKRENYLLLKKRKTISIKRNSTTDWSQISNSSRISQKQISVPKFQSIRKQSNQNQSLEQNSFQTKKINKKKNEVSLNQASSKVLLINLQKELQISEKSKVDIPQCFQITRQVKLEQFKVKKATSNKDMKTRIFFKPQVMNFKEIIQKRKLEPYRWTIDVNYKQKLKFRIGKKLKPLLLP